jgi:hypothetical protein
MLPTMNILLSREFKPVTFPHGACGFVYLMRVPRTDLYKIGSASRANKQNNAVPMRYREIHRDLNSYFFPDGTKVFQLEIVGVLPVKQFHFSDGIDRNEYAVYEDMLGVNRARTTSQYWLDANAMGAEHKFHVACGAYRVRVPDAITPKGRKLLTEFFRFTSAESTRVRKAFETATLPEFPKPRRQRQLTLSADDFRNFGVAAETPRTTNL